ncbi:MAG: hypothetical protein VB144_11155 [Clostridia bacterium]|nr:hypothetical protein [Clostridia bacterium]
MLSAAHYAHGNARRTALLDDSTGEMVRIDPTGGQYLSIEEQKLDRKYPPSVAYQ